MKGVYQHCSKKHLHRYAAEFDFRYSNRIANGINDEERTLAAIAGITGKRLTYRRTKLGIISTSMTIHDPEKLVLELSSKPRETDWLEFKQNNGSEDSLGKYISALANSAIFCEEEKAYLIFGVRDEDHELTGTTLRWGAKKIGNEPILHWLHKNLSPKINVEHCSVEIDGKHIEVFAIDPGYQEPVKFKGEPYIRIDTCLHPLKEHSGKERTIWAITNRFAFEQATAQAHVKTEEVFTKFFVDRLLGSLSANRETAQGKTQALEMEELIKNNNQGAYDVSNLFVLSAATDFRDWPLLESKSVRIIKYKDKTKLHADSDSQGRRGYVIGFNPMLDYIMNLIPHREDMEHGKRVTTYDVPKVAVREIVANAIIHQDFTAAGYGPIVEVYPDKIKISNPGKPLIPTDRFIDSPPRTRNEKLSKLMSRCDICEERGSGIDRALHAIEKVSLPPTLFQVIGEALVVTLYGPRPFAVMDKDERIRACYQHASLKFEGSDPMNNSTLRRRFGLSDKQYPQASKVISDTIAAGLIRPLSEDQSNKFAKYVPIWA